MMTRKDNDFIDFWNAGFKKLRDSGKYKELCAQAVKEHGGSTFSISSMSVMGVRFHPGYFWTRCIYGVKVVLHVHYIL